MQSLTRRSSLTGSLFSNDVPFSTFLFVGWLIYGWFLTQLLFCKHLETSHSLHSSHKVPPVSSYLGGPHTAGYLPTSSHMTSSYSSLMSCKWIDLPESSSKLVWLIVQQLIRISIVYPLLIAVRCYFCSAFKPYRTFIMVFVFMHDTYSLSTTYFIRHQLFPQTPQHFMNVSYSLILAFHLQLLSLPAVSVLPCLAVVFAMNSLLFTTDTFWCLSPNPVQLSIVALCCIMYFIHHSSLQTGRLNSVTASKSHVDSAGPSCSRPCDNSTQMDDYVLSAGHDQSKKQFTSQKCVGMGLHASQAQLAQTANCSSTYTTFPAVFPAPNFASIAYDKPQPQSSQKSECSSLQQNILSHNTTSLACEAAEALLSSAADCTHQSSHAIQTTKEDLPRQPSNLSICCNIVHAITSFASHIQQAALSAAARTEQQLTAYAQHGRHHSSSPATGDELSHCPATEREREALHHPATQRQRGVSHDNSSPPAASGGLSSSARYSGLSPRTSVFDGSTFAPMYVVCPKRGVLDDDSSSSTPHSSLDGMAYTSQGHVYDCQDEQHEQYGDMHGYHHDMPAMHAQQAHSLSHSGSLVMRDTAQDDFGDDSAEQTLSLLEAKLRAWSQLHPEAPTTFQPYESALSHSIIHFKVDDLPTLSHQRLHEAVLATARSAAVQPSCDCHNDADGTPPGPVIVPVRFHGCWRYVLHMLSIKHMDSQQSSEGNSHIDSAALSQQLATALRLTDENGTDQAVDRSSNDRDGHRHGHSYGSTDEHMAGRHGSTPDGSDAGVDGSGDVVREAVHASMLSQAVDIIPFPIALRIVRQQNAGTSSRSGFGGEKVRGSGPAGVQCHNPVLVLSLPAGLVGELSCEGSYLRVVVSVPHSMEPFHQQTWSPAQLAELPRNGEGRTQLLVSSMQPKELVLAAGTMPLLVVTVLKQQPRQGEQQQQQQQQQHDSGAADVGDEPGSSSAQPGHLSDAVLCDCAVLLLPHQAQAEVQQLFQAATAQLAGDTCQAYRHCVLPLMWDLALALSPSAVFDACSLLGTQRYAVALTRLMCYLKTYNMRHCFQMVCRSVVSASSAVASDPAQGLLPVLHAMIDTAANPSPAVSRTTPSPPVGTTIVNPTPTQAPALLGTTPPAQLGTTPPALLGTTPPAQLGTTSPAKLGTTPPAQLGTTSPAQLGTTPPAQSGTTPPAQLGTTSPAQLGTTPPAQLGTTSPAQLGTTSLAQLGTTPAAQLGATPPHPDVTSSQNSLKQIRVQDIVGNAEDTHRPVLQLPHNTVDDAYSSPMDPCLTAHVDGMHGTASCTADMTDSVTQTVPEDHEHPQVTPSGCEALTCTARSSTYDCDRSGGKAAAYGGHVDGEGMVRHDGCASASDDKLGRDFHECGSVDCSSLPASNPSLTSLCNGASITSSSHASSRRISVRDGRSYTAASEVRPGGCSLMSRRTVEEREGGRPASTLDNRGRRRCTKGVELRELETCPGTLGKEMAGGCSNALGERRDRFPKTLSEEERAGFCKASDCAATLTQYSPISSRCSLTSGKGTLQVESLSSMPHIIFSAPLIIKGMLLGWDAVVGREFHEQYVQWQVGNKGHLPSMHDFALLVVACAYLARLLLVAFNLEFPAQQRVIVSASFLFACAHQYALCKVIKSHGTLWHLRPFLVVFLRLCVCLTLFFGLEWPGLASDRMLQVILSMMGGATAGYCLFWMTYSAAVRVVLQQLPPPYLLLESALTWWQGHLTLKNVLPGWYFKGESGSCMVAGAGCWLHFALTMVSLGVAAAVEVRRMREFVNGPKSGKYKAGGQGGECSWGGE